MPAPGVPGPAGLVPPGGVPGAPGVVPPAGALGAGAAGATRPPAAGPPGTGGAEGAAGARPPPGAGLGAGRCAALDAGSCVAGPARRSSGPAAGSGRDARSGSGSARYRSGEATRSGAPSPEEAPGTGTRGPGPPGETRGHPVRAGHRRRVGRAGPACAVALLRHQRDRARGRTGGRQQGPDQHRCREPGRRARPDRGDTGQGRVRAGRRWQRAGAVGRWDGRRSGHARPGGARPGGARPGGARRSGSGRRGSRSRGRRRHSGRRHSGRRTSRGRRSRGRFDGGGRSGGRARLYGALPITVGRAGIRRSARRGGHLGGEHRIRGRGVVGGRCGGLRHRTGPRHAGPERLDARRTGLVHRRADERRHSQEGRRRPQRGSWRRRAEGPAHRPVHSVTGDGGGAGVWTPHRPCVVRDLTIGVVGVPLPRHEVPSPHGVATIVEPPDTALQVPRRPCTRSGSPTARPSDPPDGPRAWCHTT